MKNQENYNVIHQIKGNWVIFLVDVFPELQLYGKVV